MGEKPDYRSKQKQELVEEAQARGLNLERTDSKDKLAEALERDDKAKQGVTGGR